MGHEEQKDPVAQSTSVYSTTPAADCSFSPPLRCICQVSTLHKNTKQPPFSAWYGQFAPQAKFCAPGSGSSRRRQRCCGRISSFSFGICSHVTVDITHVFPRLARTGLGPSCRRRLSSMKTLTLTRTETLPSAFLERIIQRQRDRGRPPACHCLVCCVLFKLYQ